MENVSLDMQSMDSSMMDNLMLYAKSVGLLSAADTSQFSIIFKKKFDLNAPATRQEYAYILDRAISILSVQGIDFVVPKPVSSSNGASTSLNLAVGATFDKIKQGGYQNDGVKGIFTRIDYYPDYKDLSGYAQKAFASALSIGALEVKKYSDTKTVKLNYRDPFIIQRSYFLAPNDIITVGELEMSLMVVMDLKISAYTWQTIMNPPKVIVPTTTSAPAAPETTTAP